MCEIYGALCLREYHYGPSGQAAARRRLSPRHSQGRMTRDWVMPRYNVSLTHDKIQGTVHKPSARFMFFIVCKYSLIWTKRTQFSPTTIKQITLRLSLSLSLTAKNELTYGSRIKSNFVVQHNNLCYHFMTNLEI